MIIDIFNLLRESRSIRIKLTQKFIDFIRIRILGKYGSIKTACKELSLPSYNALVNWLKPNSKHATNPPLKDFIGLTKNLDIREEYLFDNILWFSTWGCHQITYLPSTIHLTEDVVTGIGMYVGDGYTSKKQNKIIFTNSDIRLLNFFGEKILKDCLQTPNHEIFVHVYSKKTELIQKEKLLRMFSVKPSETRVYRCGPERPNYKFGTYSAVRRIVLDLLIQKIKWLCLENKEFARAYLRGIFLAEGGIYYKLEKYVREVYIEMANKKEIEFICKLLKMLGIRYKKYKNIRGHYKLLISNREGLKRLRDIKIFVLKKEKQELLEIMCNSYKATKSRWWKS